MKGFETQQGRKPWLGYLSLLIMSAVLAGCSGSDGATIMGPPGEPGSAPGSTTISRTENLPGVNITITGLSGASGVDGTFQVGDTIAVSFTVTKNDGSDLPASELNSSSIYVSGPTFNYQRVIASVSNWHKNSVTNADGSYTYTTAAIPATYLAPLNDTASFGSDDGEMQGQALLSGTYTVGMQAYKNYSDTDTGGTARDVANATKDFLFGAATTLESREVVLTENCNQCHVTVQAHGGSRRDVKLCILCHTSGAEDKNVSSAAGGTPGVSIDFRTMIHKIHNGAHLPSVNGVATNADGSRDYSAPATTYKIVGYQNSVHDFSGVQFPVWPNMTIRMPVDTGYDSLSAAQKTQEDNILKGVTACDKCHGGAAQEGLIYSQPTRRVCGSCHDDIDWTKPYTSNGQTMPPQADDSTCVTCHSNPGTALGAQLAHVHPLNDSTLNPGANVTISALTPSSGATLDPGERLSVTLSIKEDGGANIDPSTLQDFHIVVSGPNNNRQIFQRITLPVAALGATASSYTFNVPQFIPLDYVGDATGGAETLTVSRAPVWASSSVVVYERTATGAGTTLAADAVQGQNYMTVNNGTIFAAGGVVVLDDGGSNEEYYKINAISGNTLSLGRISSSSMTYQPHLRMSHASGTTVDAVTLTTKTVTTAYTVTAATGEINLVAGQFTAGNAVLVSYTGDWALPSVYVHGYNNDNADDETWGEWTGKAIKDGTYNLGVWVQKRFWVIPPRVLGTSTDTHRTQYTEASIVAADGNFLVGAATTIEPYSLISSGENCNACHEQVWFHSRQGADTCLTCHGTAAFGKSGESNRNFRTLVHKLHMGEELTFASTYEGGDFAEVVFPAMPGGVKHCDKCHGAGNTAWIEPADRAHSTLQTLPMRSWRAVCGTCHDSNSAKGHIDVNTSLSGYESCAVCHGSGRTYGVELMHKNR